MAILTRSKTKSYDMKLNRKTSTDALPKMLDQLQIGEIMKQGL